jgi:hypothetical protein
MRLPFSDNGLSSYTVNVYLRNPTAASHHCLRGEVERCADRIVMGFLSYCFEINYDCYSRLCLKFCDRLHC